MYSVTLQPKRISNAAWPFLCRYELVMNQCVIFRAKIPSICTEWPVMCWCAVKKLLTHTHSKRLLRKWQASLGDTVLFKPHPVCDHSTSTFQSFGQTISITVPLLALVMTRYIEISIRFDSISIYRIEPNRQKFFSIYRDI